MSKKQKKHRQASRKADTFLDFDVEDYEYEDELAAMEIDRYVLDEEPFAVERERYSFEEQRYPFDFDRWRDDLTSRSSNRERMRQRDLRKGILRGTQVRRLPLDPDYSDEEEDQ